MVPVAITQHRSIETAINQALRHLDLEPLIKGKIVAIKPNDTWASAQDTTAVTQPDTLRAVIRYVKKFGPRELVVSGGAGAAETEDVFRIAGLLKVVEEERVPFFDHNRPPFTSVPLSYDPGKPLFERIQKGEIDPSEIITHRLDLNQAPEAYEMFKNKQDNCFKVVMTP
jgi:uncharacterized protein (DUF362 family)